MSEEETQEPGRGILYDKDRRRPYKEQDAVVQQPVDRSSEAGSFPLDQHDLGLMLCVERERLLVEMLNRDVSRNPLLSVIEIPSCRSAACQTERGR